MKPFDNPDQMLASHEAMFGPAGRFAAETVLELAPTLFAVPLDPLKIRIVFAPDEMGPYNRHTGYNASVGSSTFILANRHHCSICGDELAIDGRDGFRDFVCHELTHTRQDVLLAGNAGKRGWKAEKSRGAHRDRGWYSAIAEAAPNYLGVRIPETIWPTRRGNPARLAETEMTHWPGSIRNLAAAKDPRISADSR